MNRNTQMPGREVRRVEEKVMEVQTDGTGGLRREGGKLARTEPSSPLELATRRTLAEIRKPMHRREAAARLIFEIEHERWAEVGRLVEAHAGHPDVFIELCKASSYTGYESPLHSAAENRPTLALAMLAAGADPRRAPEGGGSILLAASGAGPGTCPQGDLAVRLELFERLLGVGVDPGEPTVAPCLSAGMRYRHSLVALFILTPKRGLAFLERLLESPAFDGWVWSTGPELSMPVAQFARTLEARVAERARPATELIEVYERWSELRKGWAGAVLRAPRRR